MDFTRVKSIIEGLLFAVGDEGIELKHLSEILELDKDTVYDLIQDMKGDYKREGRGIQIVETANAFQLTTLPEHAPYFERLVHSPSHSTLSQAALETLAIISYRQPITRAEIEEIRGVKSEKALHTLIHKMLVKEVGRGEGMGRPILYGTTKEFLEYFGLSSLNDLPPLPQELDLAEEMEIEKQMLFSRLEQKKEKEQEPF
ncbi:SMC-Scp complex subunit ScpB [Microaerobacter geothermalis]|uniref:SMC-Scp complex subunit ScpB n=1 Tax=Microaerobacter geothermalis TaxID=674972 RepID=UPI001F0C0EC4|nr:SMC-Scp complex subunit ScpB [Microaerobacter geothermalis]MCF6093487.1 SMC-Scp complex subunit ScpB [Microaerobacter geothermalis]